MNFLLFSLLLMSSTAGVKVFLAYFLAFLSLLVSMGKTYYLLPHSLAPPKGSKNETTLQAGSNRPKNWNLVLLWGWVRGR